MRRRYSACVKQIILAAAVVVCVAALAGAQTVATVYNFAGGTAPASGLPTVTFTTLADFGEGDGQYPSPLAQGTDGNFYGATYYGHRSYGGPYGFGFYLTPTGAWTVLDYACTTNYCTGSKASAGLTLAGDGNFYGTTAYGGNGPYRNVNHAGTIYRANAQIGLTTIYSFCAKLGCQDGDDPYAPLTLGSDGNLYGTTQIGGLHNAGTAYIVTLAGKFNTLHNFCAEKNCVDGGNPTSLIQATDGNFYGVAGGGTGPDCNVQVIGCGGLIFKMTPQGVTTTLYNFCSQPNCTDGAGPAVIMQAADGNLYGITDRGGIYGNDGYNGSGVIFRLSLQGELTTLYNFCAVYSCTGGISGGSILQATDGNFYGIIGGGEGATCYYGYGCGIVFELTSAGVYSTLYTFCEQLGQFCPDGILPVGIMQGTDGNFYGATYRGGPSGYGTAFKLSAGLGPFIRTVTSSGKAGSSIIILGNGLTGSTRVTFNGVAASSFKVVSDTNMTAVVPSGATTGPVVVTAPGGVLTSNVSFAISK